jgi:hypothetical protein
MSEENTAYYSPNLHVATEIRGRRSYLFMAMEEISPSMVLGLDLLYMEFFLR